MSADDHDLSDLERAVRDQLAAWGLLGTAEGAATMDIVHRLAHTEDLRPAAAAMLHAQLRTQLVDLRKLAPPADEKDGVSDLQNAYIGLRAVQ
ncbi:hypothetical protein [Streptomyces sp.]|uniref:hypothetical protein n=1 Tax=Streptomyces sp. TaxID=1931 RepID=UPI002F94F343